MSRKSTLSKDWHALIEAVGSIGGEDGLLETLGTDATTFRRASRGEIPFSESTAMALQILCDTHNLANPYRTPRCKNLVPLRLLGEALEKGFPPAPRTLDRLRDLYPDEQLIELAESEGAPEEILRAAMRLLETE